MDQISRLVFEVTGRDRQGSKVLNDAAAASDRAHAGFSRLGSTLSGLGGPFGAVTDFAGNLGSALDDTLSKAQKLGLGLTVVGVGLIAVGAKEQQAQRQLQQAIDNTGASASDYRQQIDEAVKQQEDFAHTADDTQNALNTLVTATQDTTRSLSEMGLVADIAAQKHESLTEAATQLVQAQAGNTRAFKAFGIVLDGVGPKSEQVNRALRELTDRLSGQAGASVDTFAGRLKVAETRLHDQLAALGKYGPEVTAAGVAVTLLASAEQVMIQRRIADTLEANAQAVAIERVTAAKAAETAATTADAEASAGLTASRGLGGFGLIGKFGKGFGIAGLGYLASQMVGTAVGGSSGHYLSDVGSGAAIGAGIGSVVPGIGTGVGALVGGGLGLGAALLGGSRYNPTALNSLAATPGGAQAINKYLAFERAQGSMTWQQAGAAGMDPRYNYQSGLTGKQLSALTNATDDQLHAALTATSANRQYATSLLNEKEAAEKAAASLGGQVKAMQASRGNLIGLSSAEDDLQAAMHNLAQSVHDGTHALDGHSAAAQANRTALRDTATKMLDLIAAQKAAGVSEDKVRDSAIGMSRALEENAVKLFGNKHAVDEFLRGLGVLPPQIARALGATSILAEQTGEQVMAAFATGIYNGAHLPETAAHIAAAQTFKQLRLGDLADHTAPQAYVPQQGAKKKIADEWSKLLSGLITDSAPAVDTAVNAAAKQAANQAAQNAQRLAQSTIQAVTQEYQNARKQVIDSFNLTNLPQKTDLFGQSYGPARLDAAANAYLRQLETWAHLLGELRKKGLNETALGQFEAAGVAAIPAMRQVLKDREIGTLNKDFRAISRIGGQVASAQVEATQGDHLANVLARLPQRNADALEKVLKNLHIDVNVREISKHQAKHVRAR